VSLQALCFLAAFGSVVVGSGVVAAADSAAESVRVTVLQTSDVHGRVLPWDYARAKPEDVGLGRVATRVEAIRRENPNVVLLDGGDTIQGTPGEYLQARRPSGGADPMAAVMSAMRYDAMAVGNHEFNYGLAVLRKAEKESAFPWLSANTRNAADGSPAFPETLVREVGGVRVGILGLTTPNIPNWEPEPNRPGLMWEDPVQTAGRLVPILRGEKRCDLVVVLIHSGIEVDPKTGQPDGTDAENRVAAVAKGVPGIDLILTGHSHRRIPLTRIEGVPVIQPGRYGEVLSRVDFVLEKKDGRLSVASVTGELLPSDSSVPVDAAIAKLAGPSHERAVAYMEETVVEASAPFPADRARLEDTPILDLINDAQREATGAELSLTSLLPGGRYPGLPAGAVRVRDLYGLYPYENQLVVVEVDGARLKGILERTAEFYGSAAWDAEGRRLVLTQNEKMVPYNFDALQGASYRIDPTAPVGSRIKELTYRGRPVRPEETFTLAVNAYRAQGAGGYSALKGSKVLRVYPTEIREILIDRLREKKKIDPVVDRNWVVAPDNAWAPETPRR
jgi:2',3'-cyclic-nucleotide 2'-phosphodiesterase/3'-nucleotidase